MSFLGKCDQEFKRWSGQHAVKEGSEVLPNTKLVLSASSKRSLTQNTEGESGTLSADRPRTQTRACTCLT